MKKRLLIMVILSLLLTALFTQHPSLIQAEDTAIAWESTLFCNASSGAIDYIVFGEAPDARDGPPPDTYDVAKPPTPMMPYVRIYLKDNLPTPYTTLWKDYRAYPDSSKVWNISIQWAPADDESPTTITLSWNTAMVHDSEYTSMNLCTPTGTPLKNILIDSSYTFTCPASTIQNFKIICTTENTPPETPTSPSGETTGYHGTSYTYATSSSDPDSDDLSYRFDWGDSTISNWLGPYPSGQSIQTTYTWKNPGTYQIKVQAKDTNGIQSPWSPSLSVQMTNRAPNQLTNPSPTPDATNISRTPTLHWIGSDPDTIDILTYDIYFGTTSSPPKIISRQSATSIDPGTLQNHTTYYWKIIAWDNFEGNTSSTLWSFTTTSANTSSNQTHNQTNQPPIANADISQQTSVVGTILLFNGSQSTDPDGYLTTWLWDFGDHTTGTGERTTHTYQTAGSYMVTLTVFDEKNATGNDTILVQILSTNQPPTKPLINGTRTGTKNTLYTYTVQSTDPENAFLQYTITWGDGTHNTSQLEPNGTHYSLPHSWNISGKYIITATATDNTTISEQVIFPVFIDVSFIRELGFLFDRNNDGVYDSFYINSTNITTDAQKLANGSYLLDTDTDGKWNYLYNPSLGSLTKMDTTTTTTKNPWVFFLAIIALAVVMIAVIVYLYNKKYF